MTLFNNLANSFPTDSAFAWSPYKSDMVSLSFPKDGWRVNDRMEFTVTKIEHDISTTIPGNSQAPANSGGKNFNGEGAILVGNSVNVAPQSLSIGYNPEAPHNITAESKGSYWELTTTGSDPFLYTTTLANSVRNATTVAFTFEYQSATNIADAEIFYGFPGAAAGKSSGDNLHLSNTGINAADQSKWQLFTHDLKPATTSYSWGLPGHALRFDVGSSSGNHVLIRDMKITASFSGGDSKVFLNNLNVGDKIEIEMNIKFKGVQIADKYLSAAGYDQRGFLLDNGVVKEQWAEAHPRTGIGYTADKTKVILIVVDGRQAGYSVGATTGQIGAILKGLGASYGINFDGGGSSCMVVNGQVMNQPSNTNYVLRAVANGIMVVVKE
jgi:hypothetical protein